MEATTQAVTTPTTDKAVHHRGALDREMFCPQLARLLMSAAGELGQRGNLAQVVSSIERGGVGGGGEDPNLVMLRRLGATDNRGIDSRVGQIRALEQRWRALVTKHQALALAHYLGTPRAHHTLQSSFGHGQGGLAGVVLYRWQVKQSRARERGASAGVTTVVAELARVWGELLPLEQEASACRAVLETPATLPNLPLPVRPSVPMVLRRRLLEKALSGHTRRCRARLVTLRQAREDAAASRYAAEVGLEALAPRIRALRDEQARLAAQQATLAAVGATSDDEQGLVDICRGKLEEATKGGMVDAAAADVRALHRAWYATAKQQAKAWAEQDTPAA